MLGRLAGRELAVMAGRTRRERLDVIDESIIAPCRRLVAALAIIRRRGMREYRSQAGKINRIVTAEASRRRVLEARVDVARRAGHAEVRSGERISGWRVIERRAHRGLCMAWRRAQHHRRRDSRHHQADRPQ